MLEIIAKHNSRGVFHLSASGHSGFADPGFDIVCASVSTLIQALHVGLADVLKLDKISVESNRQIPEMSIEWENVDVNSEQIAQTILLSLKAVANSYPDFVVVYEEEYVK